MSVPRNVAIDAATETTDEVIHEGEGRPTEIRQPHGPLRAGRSPHAVDSHTLRHVVTSRHLTLAYATYSTE